MNGTYRATIEHRYVLGGRRDIDCGTNYTARMIQSRNTRVVLPAAPFARPVSITTRLHIDTGSGAFCSDPNQTSLPDETKSAVNAESHLIQ